MLLLEDPDWRLRLAHCDEILGARLRDIWSTWTARPAGTDSPICAALAQDPACKNIFRTEHGMLPAHLSLLPFSTTAAAASPSSPTGDAQQDAGAHRDAWSSTLIRLDTAELFRRCSVGPALPIAAPMPVGAIAAAAAAATSARSPTPGLLGMVSIAASPSTPSWPISLGRSGFAGQAPAISILNGRSVGGVGGMEASLLKCALATWTQYNSDDDAYLALAASVLLIFQPVGAMGLPPCSLDLPQLLVGLQALAAGGDTRLRERLSALESSPRRPAVSASASDGGSAAAAAWGGPVNHGRSGSAPRTSTTRLEELLCQPPFKGPFKLRDVPAATYAQPIDGAAAALDSGAGGRGKLEKVVFLRIDKLSTGGTALTSAQALTSSEAGLHSGPMSGAAASELPAQVLTWLQLLSGALHSDPAAPRSGSSAASRAAEVVANGSASSPASDDSARPTSLPLARSGGGALEGGPAAMGVGDLCPHEGAPSPGLPNFLFEYETPAPVQLQGGSAPANPMLQRHPSLQGAQRTVSAYARSFQPSSGMHPSPLTLQQPAHGHAAAVPVAEGQQQQRTAGSYGSATYQGAATNYHATAADSYAAVGSYGSGTGRAGSTGMFGSSPPVRHLHDRAAAPQLSTSPFSSAPPASSPTASLPPAPTLFSTSPSMQTHVPREVASCWGAPTLAHTSHGLSSAHSLGSGVGVGAGMGLVHTSSSSLVPALSTSSQHRLSSAGSDTFRSAAYAQAGQAGQAASGSVPSSTATTPSGMAPANSFAAPPSSGSADRPSAHGSNSNLSSNFKGGSGGGLPPGFDLAGMGAGRGMSGGLPQSPASALDAACAALLAGGSMGSIESAIALESLLWSSSSPSAGAVQGGGTAAPGSWSGRGTGTKGSGGYGAAAVTAGRGAGGGSTSAAATAGAGLGSGGGASAGAASVASGGPHCTPSSISDASEDCGVHGPPEPETTFDALLAMERPGSNSSLGFGLGLNGFAEQWLSPPPQQGLGQGFNASGQRLGPGSGLLGTSPGSHHHHTVMGSPTQAAYSSALGAAAAAYSTAATARTLSGGNVASPAGLHGAHSTFLAPSTHPGPGAAAADAANAVSVSAAAAASAAVAAYTAAAAAAANAGANATAASSVNSVGAARPASVAGAGDKVMTGWAAVAAKGSGQGWVQGAGAQGGRGAIQPTLHDAGARAGELLGSAAAAAAAWRQATMGRGAAFAGPASVGSAAQQQSHAPASAAAAGVLGPSGSGPGGGPVGSVDAKLMFPRTSQRLREDILQLLRNVPGLKVGSCCVHRLG